MLWLITGGYAQGKTSYVKRMPAAQGALWVDLSGRTAAEDAAVDTGVEMAVSDAAERPETAAADLINRGLDTLAPDQTLVVDGFERLAVVQQADAAAVESALSALRTRARRRTVILIGTDTGSGIVPLRLSDRQLREDAGRLQTRAAGLADWVIRLFCGLPDILKRPSDRHPDAGVTLYLIRHGATASNMQRRYMGRTDEALCESGRAEIADRQSRGCFPEPDCLICSPMRRCLETAALAFPDRQPDRIESRFIERDFGDFELKNYEELRARDDYRAWLDGWGRDSPPGGESQSDIGRRVEAALRDILAENGVGAGSDRGESNPDEYPAEASSGRIVVLVIHGGVIMEIMRILGFKAYYDWQVTNGSWIRLDFDRFGRLSELPPVIGGQLVGAVV